jgi:hypothetical protein
MATNRSFCVFTITGEVGVSVAQLGNTVTFQVLVDVDCRMIGIEPNV